MPRTIQFLAIVALTAASAAAQSRGPALIDAVKAGDAAAARRLIRGSDVNVPGVDGTTALHWAVNRDDVAMVDLLLKAGAKPSVANRYGVLPLSLAAQNGNADIIERLLRAGADVSTKLPGGETALMTAARTGSPEALKALMAHGAKVDQVEETHGQSALMWAAANNNPDAIRVLVEGGANIHATSADKDFRNIGDGPRGAKAKTEYLMTPLLFAVRNGHIEATRALLEKGANVNDATVDGLSALIIAILNKHWELGSVLLQAGADPSWSKSGWTPLHQVARTRNLNVGTLPQPVPTGRIDSLELVKQLIAKGADVNAVMTEGMRGDGYRGTFNRIGATPFLLASKGVDPPLMRLLLAHGANPYTANANGTTTLMAAAGVDINVQGEDGGNYDVAMEGVKIILEQIHDDPAKINQANKKGETALHGAAWRGSNPLVELLVAKGAKLDAKTPKGFMPIDFAAGRHSGGTLREQPQTVALMRDMMIKRNLEFFDGREADEERRARSAAGGAAQLAEEEERRGRLLLSPPK